MRAGVHRDGSIHAAVRRWLGHRALCGAGRLLVVLEDPFKPRDYGVCRDCSKLAPEANR